MRLALRTAVMALAVVGAIGSPGCRSSARTSNASSSQTTQTSAPKAPTSAPASAPSAQATTPAALEQAIAKLRPLHQTISKPAPGDWLAEHAEPGQSFAQYRSYRPTLPDGQRNRIYVQPLGDFSTKQREIVKLSADYLGRFFHLQVVVQPDVPLSVVPAKARRVHPQWGDKQILTHWVLNDLLQPRLPGDAAAAIAFTSSDLWPGDGWNFVFGQASLRERVGVWSIHRNGDPEASDESFRLALVRTLKTAVHETGHMFSMKHCTAYECVMCGSNHREESDRRPLWLCPECMAKMSWGMKISPVERYRKLAAFAKAHGLAAERQFFTKSLAALGATP